MQNRLDRAIEAHAEAAFVFLEALVRARSTVGHEQAALALFSREAESLGLAITKLPFANEPLADPRAGITPPATLLSSDRFQVLATTPGEGKLHVLINGHVDVVPAESPDLWSTLPFEPTRRDGRLYGRGAGDMKSGFAVAALALRALRDVSPNLFAARRLGVLAVVEEECTGNGTLRSVTEHGVIASEVLVLEPTGLDLLVGGMGVMWVDINIASPSGHAFAADTHANAIDLGMRLVQSLRQWGAELWHSDPEPAMPASENPYSVNLGKLHAGDWTSTVPSNAMLSVRVGFPRSWTADRAETEIRSAIAAFAVAAALPIEPSVRLSGFRAEGYLLDPDSVLVRDLSAAHRDAHGVTPATLTIGSTTDARIYVNAFDTPAVCFGAIAHDMHGIDESVDLASIVAAARTLARFLLLRFGASEVRQ